MTNRLKKGLIGGAILGILCVIGAYVRSNFTADTYFVLGLWYNRVIIGLLIGAPWPNLSKKHAAIRGAILGIIVSLAFYITTGFADPISFIAGGVYGIILDVWLSKTN